MGVVQSDSSPREELVFIPDPGGDGGGESVVQVVNRRRGRVHQENGLMLRSAQITSGSSDVSAKRFEVTEVIEALEGLPKWYEMMKSPSRLTRLTACRKDFVGRLRRLLRSFLGRAACSQVPLSSSTAACTLDASNEGFAFSEYDDEPKELERGKPMSSQLAKFTNDLKRSSLGHFPSSSSSAELGGGGVKRAFSRQPQTLGRLEELGGAQPSSAKLREQSEQIPIFLM
ncbi:hypothetical protein EXIGLDRAFT_691448 [Exidia glandulosa HHB12029]|uniref:Uncharacterized protein n=1 Tax=Exidia glandulosa HHB12029 TaxID=1314781 RepID=A0A166MSR9_EXIGL|nr:hypothetical protein EXIGLDRAFT_691448 [Exidia glandulosa HHB12029]